MVREHAARNGARPEAAAGDEGFSASFRVKGEAMKNVRKGNGRSHPQATYLKNESWQPGLYPCLTP
jgi:hypothetical protein